MNIYQRLNEVRKAVAYLKKEKEVTGQGTYKVVTHDQVTAAVREHLIAHGILIVPRLAKSIVADTGMTTGKGTPFIRYEATYEIDFVNCEEPTDKVTMPMEAHAIDQGDKAPGKAISYATKYAMLKLFSIETGEEDEDRAEASNGKKEKITANADAMKNVPAERHNFVRQTASSIIDCFNADNALKAYKVYKTVEDNAEKLGVWSLLDSKMRRTLKQYDRDHLRGLLPKENEDASVRQH